MVDFFLSYRRFHLPRFARHQMRRRLRSTVVATTRITESGSFSLLLFSPIVIFREPLFDLSLSLSSLLSFSSLSSSTSLFCEVMDDQLFDASVDSSIADAAVAMTTTAMMEKKRNGNRSGETTTTTMIMMTMTMLELNLSAHEMRRVHVEQELFRLGPMQRLPPT